MSFRGSASRIGCLFISLFAAGSVAGCSSSDGTSSATGGAGNGNAGASGNPALGGGAAGATGAAGSAGSTAVGGSSAGSGGSIGGGNGGMAGGNSAAGNGGAAGGGGQGGATSCAGNAISLSKNGSGNDSDAALARVVIDMMTDLPLGNSNRTIEFWADIKPTDWVGEKNELYFYGDPATNAAGFGLDFGTNPVSGMMTNHATLNPVTAGGFNDDSTNDLGITSTARQWVHIAMSWNGTAVKTYVNGALKITSPGMAGTAMLATASSPITLGYNPQNKGCFNGSFDELRIWKTARTDAEISANYNQNVATEDPNLVGYWKFDEPPGSSTAADSVTTAGHTPHPGALTSATPADLPTFITPTSPAPIHCR